MNLSEQHGGGAGPARGDASAPGIIILATYLPISEARRQQAGAIMADIFRIANKRRSGTSRRERERRPS